MTGREAELAKATAALSAGSGGVVFTGASGVGKTRLARELVARLAAAGHRVQHLAGTRAAAGIPFGAFVSYLDPGQAGGDPTSSLSQIIVRISGRNGSPPGTSVTTESVDPIRRPVLFVDDAHLLDGASAAAVHHLALTREAAVVLTILSGHRCHDAVSRIWRDGYASLVDIGQLDRNAVGRLVAAGLGGPVDAYTLGRILHLTAGNALAIYEMVTTAREAGALRADDGVWRWTGGWIRSPHLEDMVAATVSGSEPVERDALLLVALAGPIATDLLATLTDADVVESMCERGLLRAAEHGGTVSLPQPLYGEVLVERAPPVTLRRLRRRLAAALDDSANLLLRVKLLADAGERPADEDLVAAADRAATSLDGELAERLATMAAPQTPGRAIALARALSLRRRFDEVEAVLSEAEPEKPALDVATARIVNYIRGLRRPELAKIYLARLTDRTGAESALLSRILQVYAATLTRRYADAAEACADDPMLEEFSVEGPAGWAVFQLAGAYYQLGRADDCLALLLRHLRPDMQPETALALRFATVGALIELGRIDEASTRSDELVDWGTRIGWPAAACLGTANQGDILFYRGRFEQSVNTMRDAAALARDNAPGTSRHWILCRLAIAEAAMGRHDMAKSVLAEAARFRAGHETPYLREEELRAQTFLHACAGEISSAVSLLNELVGPTIEEGAWAQTIEVAWLLARIGRAREAADIVAEMPVFTPYARVRVNHIRALADGSADALMSVAAQFEELGAEGLAAEAADFAADLYSGRGPYREFMAACRTRDRLLASAGTMRLGWWPSRQRVALSPREREVAVLASAGRSSPEIASSLHLSVRTVENHLQRAYTKLGVTNRTELRGAIQHTT
jgi:DNA-binding CsgD family transcriptional regulator